MKPQIYRHDHGITVHDIMVCGKESGFERVTRPVVSSIENGDKTGMMPCPTFAKRIKAKYPGYYATLPFSKPSKASGGNRKLKNRFYFRTSDEFAARMEKAKEALCYSTTQDFVLFALDTFMQGIEKAASDAGTSKAAHKRAVNESITWKKENVNESV